MSIVENSVFDPINPNYYQLTEDFEVIDVTKYLTGCIAQAVQYIMRSTRVDGAWKDNSARVQDLKKAVWFVEAELSKVSRENQVDSFAGLDLSYDVFDSWLPQELREPMHMIIQLGSGNYPQSQGFDIEYLHYVINDYIGKIKQSM